jgi:hypothetical protein
MGNIASTVTVMVTFDQSAGMIENARFQMKNTDIVYDLKIKIQSKMGVPISQQCLTLYGHPDALTDYECVGKFKVPIRLDLKSE